MPQLELTSAVEIFVPLSPWQRMNKRGRLKTIGHVDLWNLVSITTFCGHQKNKKERKKWPTCFESNNCTLFMSVHVGKLIIQKENKKAGNVISLI